MTTDKIIDAQIEEHSPDPKPAPRTLTAVDLGVRMIAITLGLFVATFVILALVAILPAAAGPARVAFLFAALTGGSAAALTTAAYLIRAAMGSGKGVSSAAYLWAFVVLALVFAVLYAVMLLAGWLTL